MSKKDHLFVLELVNELPFNVGKKLCCSILRGESSERSKKLRLAELTSFGILGGYSEQELTRFLDHLMRSQLLTIVTEKGRYPVLSLTALGTQELVERNLTCSVDEVLKQKVIVSKKSSLVAAPITDQDKQLFAAFAFFLEGFTDEQKKAVVCMDDAQVCVAGAGSGKTRVLTYKIVYLVKYAGVDPKRIIAITFTRKARQEMQERLAHLLPDVRINIQTFNSFAERQLQRHGHLLYETPKVMIDTRSFIGLVTSAIQAIGFTVEQFIDLYYEPRERKGKEHRQLFFSFLYDFRAILDAYVLHGKDEEFFTQHLQSAPLHEKQVAQDIVRLVLLVAKELQTRNLRTYADQLVDCIKLYRKSPQVIPRYDWMLIDEFQDVNEEQLDLVSIMQPKKLFCVGDPRQSIYAWRGSNPDLIYEVAEKGITAQHDRVTMMLLTKNFRSAKQVVDVANALLEKQTHYTAMQAASERQGKVTCMQYSSENEEAQSVVKHILELACDRNEIFVLSRTNKGLEKIAKACDDHDIKYLLRTDEKKMTDLSPQEGQITLATVHAIKGLEAEIVFVVGCNTANYPCRAKDHRYVELLTAKQDYDQFEEERRILYVACTRAKKETHISYFGTKSSFLNNSVLGNAVGVQQTLTQKTVNTDRLMWQRKMLRSWRFETAKSLNVPPFIIFSDKVLEQLLEFQPMTTDDLYNINGLGKAKISQFGEELLGVLHS